MDKRQSDMSHSTLTLATYNMRKAVGLDRRRDPDRILRVLEEVGADIIALQEADRRTGGRAAAVPHELWEGHAHWLPVPLGVKNRRALDRLPKVGARVDEWLKVDTRNIGWHGNAILVRPTVGVLDVAAGPGGCSRNPSCRRPYRATRARPAAARTAVHREVLALAGSQPQSHHFPWASLGLGGRLTEDQEDFVDY